MASKHPRSVRNDVNPSNPIAHVAYQSKDLSKNEPQGGGGAKEIVPVTATLRNKLINNLAKATTAMAASASAYPGIPQVMIIQLRDEAIAKSHRPLKLIDEAELLPLGHGNSNEMLVMATSVSVNKLDKVIKNRDTKAIRANLSVIDCFEAWGIQRRLPKILRGKPIEDVRRIFLDAQRRIMIQLFAYKNLSQRETTMEKLIALLKRVNLKVDLLPQPSGPSIVFVDVDGKLTTSVLSEILNFPGIRHVQSEPEVVPEALSNLTAQGNAKPTFTKKTPDPTLPVVGVFDTGVNPKTTLLTPWVVGRETYVLPPDTDYLHGTAVGSLIVDCSGLNAKHPVFPIAPCRIYDVCGLELKNTYVSDLILRLREVVKDQPQIKVWNLSLSADVISDEEFSVFGRELDSLSDAHNVLFVVAAGNYTANPRRKWPITNANLSDRLHSPGDSVRALTVGAITHLESAKSLVKKGEPAPYSRCGPGPLFTPKPDVVHVGGNADATFSPTGIGVNVLGPGGVVVAGIGTSYATPIVAAMAAHTWQQLDQPRGKHALAVTPTMVKAIMIHSAQLNSPERNALERRYYGAGVSFDPSNILLDSDSSFTMMFELDIVDTMKWRKAPFPIPPALTNNGKLCCEVIVTAAYAPILDNDAGAEYVRFNLEVGFGILELNEKGKLEFKGQVPADGELGTTGFEKAQVEHGGKWSPVKTFRRRFSKGKAGRTWALQATVTRRAFEPPMKKPLKAVIFVTLRSLDGDTNVYQEGQRELAAQNWATQNLTSSIPITLRA